MTDGNQIRCEVCGCLLFGNESDKCPNCETDLDRQRRLTFRVTPVERPDGTDGPAVLPEPWPSLKKLANKLDEVRFQTDEERPRSDLQNSLDVLTAAALAMAGQADPRCSVVNHFLRALGQHIAGHLGDLRDLEHHVREVSPAFPSWLPNESLADSIGYVRDGLRSKRDPVPALCYSLEDLPEWEVNVQPMAPEHALHRTVLVRAPEPLTARMVALNMARERWPGKDFKAVSAVPHFAG